MTKFVRLSGLSEKIFSRVFVGCIAVFVLVASGNVHALFGRYLPLSLSGSLGYNYGYFTSGDAASETTSLTGSVNAIGYVWQPWFATTSMALTVGVSNTETTASSSDSTSSSGSFGLNVFPRSRFPFSLNYSRSDSRIDSFSDADQTSGDSQYTINRLTLRQLYEGRATRRSVGSRTNFWYSTTDYESETLQSESESMGFQYQIRLVPHNFLVTASRSTSDTTDSPLKPLTDVASVSHTYTPDSDLGITSLATVVKIDDGVGTSESNITQVSSNFFWRPEHRAVNVNGGVRVSESETLSQGTSSEQKSLNTNLGMSYRLTRRINLGASIALGTSDTGASQSLSTTESVRLNFSSRQSEVSGFTYIWQWGINGSNSDTRVDNGITETSSSIQTTGMQLGHSATRRWVPSKGSSVGLNLAQAGTVSQSSENDELTEGLSHSAGMSWNSRGRAGSTYGSLQISDSRSSGQQDTDFQYLSASLSQDLTISRLSSFDGTVGYTESRQKTVSDVPGASSSSLTRNVRANFSYRHDRPFGLYNMNFTSRLTGSRSIDSFSPDTLWDWDNRLRYRLGLLDTSLSLRIIESAGGVASKSLYFQASRSF
ncbi:MAG: hypothetical protein KAU29_01325 [Gammaproteobacteria bacterium]|nr:hypothetical protein [Gammaproteobacteria bacterium]